MSKLTKDITKETNITHNGKPVSITLTKDGEIIFKIKHSRSDFRIGIEELFKNLAGLNKQEKPKPKKGDETVSLNHLRSMNAVLDLDYKLKVKFDDVIRRAIEENE